MTNEESILLVQILKALETYAGQDLTKIYAAVGVLELAKAMIVEGFDRE
jgi:hypothetical protein